MNSPFFSVIVPVFNAEATVDSAMASVFAQTDADFEIILIDDGSTDTSLARMLAWAARDERVRVIAQDNAGVARARNLGIEMARGLLLAFLDADDTWLPDKLAAHRAHHAADPEIDISFAKVAFVEDRAGDARSAMTCSTVPAAPLTLLQIIAENPVCTASNLVASSGWVRAIGGFREAMHYSEDQEWLARSIAAGARVAGIDRLLVEYRLSTDGLSSSLARMHAGWRELAQPYADRVDLRSAEAIYLRYLARRALRTGGSSTTAIRYVFEGLACDASAFLSDRRRGVMTLLGALASAFLPSALRTRIFA